MEFTEQQKLDVQAEYGARRRRQFVVIAVIVIAAAVFVGSDALGLPAAVAESSFVALAVCAVGFSLYNWRCPACSKYLGKSISHAFCPHCGVALR